MMDERFKLAGKLRALPVSDSSSVTVPASQSNKRSVLAPRLSRAHAVHVLYSELPPSGGYDAGQQCSETHSVYHAIPKYIRE